MKLTRSDWYAVGSYAAGGGLSGGIMAFGAFFERPVSPGHILTGLSGMAISVGGLVRVIANRNGAPATAIVADAPIVAQDTKIVTAATPDVARNVTTNTTAPILAPLASSAQVPPSAPSATFPPPPR
jgi:hypothetical protein